MGIQPYNHKTLLAAFSSLILSQILITAASPQYPLCSQGPFNTHFELTDCWDLPKGGFVNDQARNACFCDDDGPILDWLRDTYATCTCTTTEEAAVIFYRNCNDTSTDTLSTTPDMTVDQMMMKATGNANCTTSEPEEKKTGGKSRTAMIAGAVVGAVTASILATIAVLNFCVVPKDETFWAWIKDRMRSREGQGPAPAPVPGGERLIPEAAQVANGQMVVEPGQVENEQPMREAEQV